jgi:hypothetical protein
MSRFSRRAFLVRGSMGAAAAAIATAIPGMPSLATTATEEAPATDDAAVSTFGTEVSSAQPLIAHVTDLRSGQMSLFLGEREFTVVDRGLAGRLFGAAK